MTALSAILFAIGIWLVLCVGAFALTIKPPKKQIEEEYEVDVESLLAPHKQICTNCHRGPLRISILHYKRSLDFNFNEVEEISVEGNLVVYCSLDELRDHVGKLVIASLPRHYENWSLDA